MAQALYLVMALDETDLEMGMSEQDLACAIVGSFYCFSYYTCFHAPLAQYDCGLVTLRPLSGAEREQALFSFFAAHSAWPGAVFEVRLLV